MRFVVSLLCTHILFLPLCWAALPSDANNAISFYRDKKSLFPSGQAGRQSLTQNILKQATENVYRINWASKEYIINADNLVRDIHLSRFVTTPHAAATYAAPHDKSVQISSVRKSSQLEVLQIRSQFAQVQTLEKKVLGWIKITDIVPRHDDPGILLSTEHIKVRKLPSEQSLVIGELSPLTRIIPLEIGTHFVKFIFGTQTVYAPLDEFLSRSDFAVMAYHPKIKWKYITQRQNHLLQTTDQQTLLLEEIKGYVTDSKKAVYLRARNSQNLPIINHVEIIEPQLETWRLSLIKGHGEVWWKEAQEISPKNKNNRSQITTDDLIKRKIHSIAFSDTNPNVGLASANGVFKTEDGQTWTRIESFKNENYIVAIHPNGTWFAGQYRSSNKGKSFEPFIRWDNLARTIELNTQRHPQQIKIVDIQPLANSRIQIEVDTGSKKLKLRSLIGDLQWEFIRP